MTEQDAFEAWYEPDEDNRKVVAATWRSANGGYKNIAPNYLRGCWEGWQAASAGKAELLEALKKTREFIDTVHDGEYGYSDCTRDELVEKLDAIIAKHGA